MRLKYTIVCLMSLVGTANAQFQNYVLKDPDPNTISHSYIGRDYVRLTNGYKFKAETGITMNAKTTAGLTQGQTNTFLNVTTDNDANALTTVNTTNAVGQIPISSSVSPSGAKCYSVPIEIVPGRMGFQPNISLSYNSQAGNGLVGMGWSISGLSSIERVNKNMFFDGKNDIPALSKDDGFALDGVRLIKNTVTSTSTQFNYETVTGNTQVIAYVNGDIVKYFKVLYPNGTVGIMGYADNTVSKLSYPVTSLTDLNGSVISYLYDVTDNLDLNGGTTNEVYYITEIDYGGIPNKTSDFAKLMFTYDATRTDQIISLQSTKSCIYRKRLSKIQSYVNSNLIRTYQLTFSNTDPRITSNQNDVSRLTQINSFINDGNSVSDNLNPLKFYYGENISPSVNVTPVTFSNANFDMTSTVNPINAIRGKFDVNPQNDALLVFPKKEAYTKLANGKYTTNYLNNEQIKVYQNVKDGSSDPCPVIENGLENPIFTTGDGFEDVFAANVDGKGQDEIVKVNVSFVNFVENYKEYLTFNVYGVNNNKKLQLLNSYDYSLGVALSSGMGTYSVTPWKFYTGNFTGHGKTEVLALSKDNNIKNKALLVYLDGAATNIFTQSNLTDTSDPTERIYPMDIDGDGQTEIVCVKASQTVLYKYVDNISGFQSVGTWALTTNDFNEPNARQILFADLNGDGNIDIIFSPKAQYPVPTTYQSKTRYAPEGLQNNRLWVEFPYRLCDNCGYPQFSAYKDPVTKSAVCPKFITYDNNLNLYSELHPNFPDDSYYWEYFHNKTSTAPSTFPICNLNHGNYPTMISSNRARSYCPGCGDKIEYNLSECDYSHCWKCGRETDMILGGQYCYYCWAWSFSMSDWSYTYTPPTTYETISSKDWIYKYTNGRSIVKTETDNNGIIRGNDQKYSVHEINGDDTPDLIIQTNNGFFAFSFDIKNRKFQNQYYISHSNQDLTNSYELLDYDLNSGHSYSALLALGSNKLTSCEFPFNHIRSTMISLMVNSMGMADKTDYNQLSQGTNYTMGNSAVFPYTDYSGTFWVTAQTKSMYNKQMIGNATYSYTGAIAHNQGLGLLGFSSMVSTDLMKNKKVTTEFDPKHSGAVTHQISDETESSFTYNSDTWTNTKMKLLLTNKTVTDSLKGNTVSVSYPIDKYDDYGNAGTEVTNFKNAVTQATTMTSTVINTFENRLGDTSQPEAVNLIGLLTNRVTTNVRGSTTFSQTEGYVYYPDNRLQYARKYIGSNWVSEIEYKYNTDYGTLREETVHNKITNASADDLITKYEYCPNDQCSLWKKTNPFGLVTEYSYDFLTSNKRLLMGVTDYLNNTITYGYDNWRRKNNEVSKVVTDVITTSINLDWNKAESEPKRQIKEKVTTTNQPETNTYADAFGRETRKTIVGFDGSLVSADKEYDTFGRMLSSTAPYKTTPLWTSYRYDEFDRPTSVVQPNGSITTYTYEGNKISENKDGIITSKTTDATGKLVSSTDGGGEVIYTYRADGQPDNVNTEGVITSFKYDDPYNRQTKLIDPSAGTVGTAYDDAAHKVTQTWNSGKNISMVMNKFGQPTSKTTKDLVNTDITTTYGYDSYGRPTSSSSTNGTSKEMVYDPTTGRLSSMSETANGKTYQEVYGYDNGRIGSISCNTGSGTTLNNLTSVVYKYTTNGYLYRLEDGWGNRFSETNSVNELGQETSVLLGNGLTTTKSYTPEGLWTNVTASNGSNVIQNMNYDFNRINGTLNSRTDNLHNHISESFTYDNLYRLKSFGSGTMDYKLNGNIANKPDVGAYTYPDTSKPYTLGSVNTSSDLKNELDVDYTVMSRPTSIRPSLTNPATTGINAVFTYNDDYDRATMQVKLGTTETLSKIYFAGGKYEIETVGGVDKQRLYVDGSPYDASVLLEKAGSNAAQTYYLHRDYLSSITQITNNNGILAAEYSYDAWGRLRNPVDWTPYTQSQLQQYSMPYGGRGYTGHEQLNGFGIINMNARLYDPLLGRFLAPDPQVADPDETNGFNRYAYASNNPLMFTDESGERRKYSDGNPNIIIPSGNNSGGFQFQWNFTNGNKGSGNNTNNTGSGFNIGNSVTGLSAGGGYTDYSSGFSGSYGGGLPDGSLSGLPGLIMYGIDILSRNPDSRFQPQRATYTPPVTIGANTTPPKLAKPVGTGASSVYSGGGNRRYSNNSSGHSAVESVTDFFKRLYHLAFVESEMEMLYGHDERYSSTKDVELISTSAGVVLSAGSLGEQALGKTGLLGKPFGLISKPVSIYNTYTSFNSITSPNATLINYLDLGVGTADLAASFELLGSANPYVAAGAFVYGAGRIGYDFLIPSPQIGPTYNLGVPKPNRIDWWR